MDEQLGLFDAAKGDAAKGEAVSRVEANASRAWLDMAWKALRQAVDGRVLITSDDVWSILAEWMVAPPHEPRAMGPVMRRGVSEGIIKPTYDFVPSDLPQNHRRPVRVYEVVR